MTLKQVLNKISEILIRGNIEDASFEAKQILSFVSGLPISKILLNLGKVTSEDFEKMKDIASRRAEGYPLQYIFGSWEFYSLPFKVGEGVLIPRADTEILVDTALEFLKDKENLDIIDLCSGSGCIAISIDKNSEGHKIEALEKFQKAFGYLKENIKLNESNVKAILGDVFIPHNKKYDLILSNPPYIRKDVCETLSAEVKQEPITALDGGDDGLIFYKDICEKWAPLLNKGGALMVEIGFDQKEEVMDLFAKANLSEIRCIKDLNGNDRVIVGTMNL